MTLQWSERFLSWIGESQAAWTQDLGSGTIYVTECTAAPSCCSYKLYRLPPQRQQETKHRG